MRRRWTWTCTEKKTQQYHTDSTPLDTRKTGKRTTQDNLASNGRKLPEDPELHPGYNPEAGPDHTGE